MVNDSIATKFSNDRDRRHSSLSTGIAFAMTLAIAIGPLGSENGAQAQSPDTTKKPVKKPEKITMKAFMSLDKIPAGGQCDVAIVIDIKEGWHINANPADPDFLIPTTLMVKSKQGVKLSSVKYPKGQRYQLPIFNQPILAYEQQVILRGVLTAPKIAAGNTDELELIVRFQACDEKSCDLPKTLAIKGKVMVASPTEAIRKVNQKYFSTKPDVSQNSN